MAIVGGPVRHRRLLGRIEHGRVNRSNLVAVDEEPFGEHVSPGCRAWFPHEHDHPQSDACFFIDDRVTPCGDQRHVELLQVRRTVSSPAVCRRRAGRRLRASTIRDGTTSCTRAAAASRHHRSVLDTRAPGFVEDDRAVVGREPVEIAVGDRLQGGTGRAGVFGHRALGGRVRDETLGIHERPAWPVGSEVILARDDPFGFRDSSLFHSQP